jgi:aminoglycoside phosphotransferase family enzyme
MSTPTVRSADSTPHPAAPWTADVANDVRETAISTVILSGDRVWKLRKPVSYPFSTSAASLHSDGSVSARCS